MTLTNPLRRWAPRAEAGRRIGTRLGLGFAAVFVVAVLAAGVGGWQMHRMHQQFDGMLDQRVPVLTELQALAQDVTTVNLAARDAVLAATPEAAAAALKQIEDGRTEIGEHIARVQPLLKADPASQAAADEVGTMSSGVLVVLLKFSRQLKAEQSDAAKTLLSSMLQPRMAAFTAKVESLQALQVKRLEEMRQDATRAVELSLALIGGVLLLGMATAAALAWTISRGISQAVNATVTLAESIADGDLSRGLPVTRRDELGRLQQALLAMQRHLGDLVGSMRQAADRVSDASREIAEGGRHLSARSDSATVALQQTANAMQALVNTVSNSAQAAIQADLMATQSAESAGHGGQVMAEMDRRMDQIAESSRRISDITGVIDSIAFQTNILALNAAVEAARAGEQGRGFAVVAGEVRALAQRSASAAREIKSLIGNSVGQVESGSRLVKEAGSAMRNIVDSVGGVSGIVQSISEDGKSQHQGLAEISRSVGQLDEMTQQNATLVQRSAGAAEALAEQAATLQGLINRFRLAAA